jgi:putative redox protein
MAMETGTMIVTHESGMKFRAVTCGGQVFSAEPSPGLGGSGQNPNPIDYLTGALGSCTGIKLLMGLEAANLRPDSLRITIEGKRRELPPAIFLNLHLTFFLEGELDEKIVAQSVHDVMTISCPVAVMLGKATTLTWDFYIGN